MAYPRIRSLWACLLIRRADLDQAGGRGVLPGSDRIDLTGLTAGCVGEGRFKTPYGSAIMAMAVAIVTIANVTERTDRSVDRRPPTADERPTDRLANGPNAADRPTDRPTNPARQTNRRTNRSTDRVTDRSISRPIDRDQYADRTARPNGDRPTDYPDRPCSERPNGDGPSDIPTFRPTDTDHRDHERSALAMPHRTL